MNLKYISPLKNAFPTGKVFLVLISLLFSAVIQAGIHSYASSSVLSSGKFVKVRIQNSGIYRITYEDLESLGLNPQKISVFGYGGAMLEQSFSIAKYDDLPEIAVYENKGSDGVFNSGDYILFYAQGVNSWKYDSYRTMFVHQANYYSKYGYYFLSSDAGSQKRITPSATEVPDGSTVYSSDEFVAYDLYEKDLQSLARSGKEFYGESFSDVLTMSLNFNMPNLVQKENSVKARLDVAANSPEISSFSLSLNGSANSILYVPSKSETDHYEKAKSASGVFSYTANSSSLSFKLTYTKTTTVSVGYLNYLEVNARRKLVMTDASMPFRNVDYLGSDTFTKYKLSSSNENVLILDLTNKVEAKQVTSNYSNAVTEFTLPNKTVQEYVAIDLGKVSQLPKPEIVGVVPNQDLHSTPQVDMVIISHPDFMGQAQKLADSHHERENITVAVVSTEQVYNEFSSGAPDATAYRWMMKMLYDRGVASGDADQMPKYLLLFGRGSFDNRHLLTSSSESFVLTYQAENSLVETLSYVTDDYFGFLEDNEGTQVPAHTLELGIGRIPAMTVQHATDVVNKLVSYMKNERKGNWKNQLCYLADDGDLALHMRQADSIASYIGRTYPQFQMNKIYLDAYQQIITASGESYPVARSQFHNLLHAGMLVLDYTGHAGPTGWTNEQILSVNDVKAMSNVNLPLWIGATCDFLQFDIPTISAGEHVLLNPLGGGVGIISAARPVYASQNYPINLKLNQYLFIQDSEGDHMTVGDALKKAKNSIGTEINKLCYIYMGDPALKLNYPTQYQIVTTSVNENVILGNDTLKALSEAVVGGYVADQSGKKVEDFNGSLHAVIYDKLQKITTLNNDNSGSLTYYDRTNKLFSGKAEVQNGEFSLQFMLPKDIKYNYGTGRINFYANDTINGDEAQGYFEKFLIGGSNPDVIDETEGPETLMYLNSSNFENGGKVNETPMFYAYVEDDNGVNRVGSGIGHDMLLVIDEDPGQTYILNDYFESSFNSYKSGWVKYKLPELKSGKHTLGFRVWDLMNNSTTKTLEFEVIKGLEPVIFNVFNYPNPVIENTRIVVQHDRPETILKTTIDVHDMAGRLIWSFTQSTADEVYWDLVGANGVKVPRGIYLYKVTIESDDTVVQSKIAKMIVR